MEAKTSPMTRTLLLCGAVSGPLFILAVLVQSFTVPGFDIRVDLISLLSLSTHGFVQIANFTLCGVLNLLYAVGLWRRLHGGPSGTFAPIFIGLYGLLLVVVGLFVTDPSNGFPPGSVTPTMPSSHGMIHAGGALWVFVTCAATLAVFVRHFLARRERRWAAYCGVSSLAMLAIFFGSFTFKTSASLFLDVSLVIGWVGVSVFAMQLLAEPAETRQPAWQA
jgi:Protein of unknown function (DUF998)